MGKSHSSIKYNQEWRDNHREQLRKSLRLNSSLRRKKRRNEIIQLLGSKCSNPYNLNHGDFLIDKRCLQIDHVNGGGQKQLKINQQGEMYYRRLLKEIKAGSKDYQLLCANCNWIKRYENKEFMKPK